MNPEYDDSNLHMDNLHTTNMDDDGNGLDDEDGAVVQRRYSVSPIQWTKAMYKGNTVEING